jgi:hypothetical protein
MNTNLKNPDLLRTYTKETEGKTGSDAIVLPKKTKGTKDTKKNPQYNLNSFISAKKKLPKDVLLSPSLTMEVGIRKMFREEGIDFDVGECGAHIIMFNKIAVQIYQAKDLQHDAETMLSDFSSKFDNSYQIFFIIIIFIEFDEQFEGEKRLMKRKLHEWNTAIGEKVKLITIDRIEELYYFLKNIYTHNKKKRIS